MTRLIGRAVRPRTSWAEAGTVDADGHVVWRACLPGGLLFEVHRVGPYRASLRVWSERGAGALVVRAATRLTGDAAHGADAGDVAGWLKLLEEWSERADA